ncbi:hypothetical protein BPAE_0227g00060 [Botrytis paeoniae]|uniref:Uncharacterized protein n=1 Tax=Botrytis paeoniae TaxID=278948 RepID=A0A4Z1F9L3_9HELO|nr:hypothetical protein BPAE_0227g00060 [Botrytis paeoniae]
MNETLRERRISFRPPVISSLYSIKSTNTPPLKESQEETRRLCIFILIVAECRVAVRDGNIESQNPAVLLRRSQKISEDTLSIRRFL